MKKLAEFPRADREVPELVGFLHHLVVSGTLGDGHESLEGFARMNFVEVMDLGQ
ncbi:hypothetical protein [Streptomyces albipurpureus]|uniref:Uncharacterized protein n=1 Tax=Streptomyces albipurpureus TaxID=2897419 RepID=A0ABT0UZ42_9ACTN|nr:hypothetical protein [Streptomyces sp. CWNU-1]MCM2393750.1 hypothetical protein [Streptomyces sp. CWNU-1]